MFAVITYDLTPVTDQVTALSSALTGSSGAVLVIGAGLAIAALVFGGKKLWRLFKSFTS